MTFPYGARTGFIPRETNRQNYSFMVLYILIITYLDIRQEDKIVNTVANSTCSQFLHDALASDS
jgi:hypothetical protein